MPELGVALAAIFLAVVGFSEFAAWRMSRGLAPARAGGRCVVVVLGYPSGRNGRLHPVQRWRTEIGIRTLATVGEGSLVVFSGAATRGATESEAAVMARYAVSGLGVPQDRVRLEQRAKSTWENIVYSLQFAESVEQIAIASDPFHSEKARRYLVHQRPDLAGRVVRAEDYRILERWWLKVLYLAYYLKLRVSRTYGQPPASTRGGRPPACP